MGKARSTFSGRENLVVLRAIFAVFIATIMVTAFRAGFAQESVYLPLALAPGDRFSVEFVHTRTQNDESKTADIVSSILIEEIKDDGFTASWTTHSVKSDGLTINARHPQAADYLLGVPIRYVADIDGTPVRVVGKSQLLETLLEGPIFESQPRERVTRVRSFIDSMPEEVLAQMFLKVPAYMALCQGTDLVPGIPNETVTQVPSPIGSVPADAEVSYLLDGFDERNELARIEYRLTLDSDGMKKMMLAIIEQADPDKQISQSEIANTVMQRNDSASCDVNVENGLAESVRLTTEIQIAEEVKSESYVISLYPSSSAPK